MSLSRKAFICYCRMAEMDLPHCEKDQTEEDVNFFPVGLQICYFFSRISDGKFDLVRVL